MQVRSHDKLQGVASTQLNLVAALDRLLVEGAVRQPLQIHQRHLGAHYLCLREDIQDVRDQTCTRKRFCVELLNCDAAQFWSVSC